MLSAEQWATVPPTDELPTASEIVRETGLEPASLSAPDPKSHVGHSLPDSTGSSSEPDATERQPATGDDAESTTESTTDGGSDDEPPSVAKPAKPQAWIPIPARTPLSLCKSCKAPIYWSVTALGRNVPVSIALEGSVAPTQYAQGRGVSHFTDCPDASSHSKRPAKTPRQTELL